jgi:hypothetical protein
MNKKIARSYIVTKRWLLLKKETLRVRSSRLDYKDGVLARKALHKTRRFLQPGVIDNEENQVVQLHRKIDAPV